MKKNYFILPVLMLLLTYSCSGKEPIKLSADSLLTNEVLKKVEIIRNAYEVKDTGILRDQIHADLVEGIINNLYFEKVQMFFSPRMVRITGETVIVNLNWQGIWHISKDKKIENRGLANLVMQKDTSKLLQIEGDNPFVIPFARQ